MRSGLTGLSMGSRPRGPDRRPDAKGSMRIDGLYRLEWVWESALRRSGVHLYACSHR
jgi:hypothetical protein